MVFKILRQICLKAVIMLPLLSCAWAAGAAESAAETKIDTGDTAFVIISTALVMLMTLPGLALFYGGLSRRKNVLSTVMYSFFALVLVSLQWMICGYSLSFGPDSGHMVGSLDWLFLKGVGVEPNPDYSATVPHQLFMVFQMMFAVISAALISGAFAERMRFPAYVAFILLWTTLIYDPVAHWVWGCGGWLRGLGALDFAGGTVVHILSGVSGLVACLVIGRRRGYGSEPMIPHSLPLVVLGTGLLWFGWFGFNAGSALGANGLAVSAFVATHLATAAAALSWVVVEWLHHGRPTTLGAASGAVAGLVAVTPAAGFVAPAPAAIIGLAAGGLCYTAVAVVKARLGYDDALDAFGVHGVGGTWGAVATGLFASTAVNPAGADGLFYGSPELVVKQLVSIAASWAVAAAGTFVILKLTGLFLDLRASEGEEEKGLDLALHGEDAYTDFVVSAAPSFSAGLLESGTVKEPVNGTTPA